MLWATMRFIAPYLGDYQTYAIWSLVILSVYHLVQFDNVDLRSDS
jgi:hypothetical protein